MEPMRALRDAISEVLETMCFLCPVPVKETPRNRPARHQWSVVEVRFAGEGCGFLRIHFPMEIAQEMARSLIGKFERECPEEEVQDVLREVTNMVGGGLLQRLDPDARTTLFIPRVIEGNVPWDPSKGLAMDLDGLLILAELHWKEARCDEDRS